MTNPDRHMFGALPLGSSQVALDAARPSESICACTRRSRRDPPPGRPATGRGGAHDAVTGPGRTSPAGGAARHRTQQDPHPAALQRPGPGHRRLPRTAGRPGDGGSQPIEAEGRYPGRLTVRSRRLMASEYSTHARRQRQVGRARLGACRSWLPEPGQGDSRRSTASSRTCG